MESNHYEMKPRFQSLPFFKNELIVWVACYFTVFMMLKTLFQNISKRSHRICSSFAIIEAIMAGTNSLKRFFKKNSW